MTPFIAEILGTAILILLGGGVVASCVLKEPKATALGGSLLPQDGQWLFL